VALPRNKVLPPRPSPALVRQPWLRRRRSENWCRAEQEHAPDAFTNSHRSPSFPSRPSSDGDSTRTPGSRSPRAPTRRSFTVDYKLRVTSQHPYCVQSATEPGIVPRWPVTVGCLYWPGCGFIWMKIFRRRLPSSLGRSG